jgi:hypothetical protein
MLPHTLPLTLSRLRVAARKARRAADYVQATMGLEAQALGRRDYRELVRRAFRAEVARFAAA